MPTAEILSKIPLWFTLSKADRKSIYTILSSFSLFNALCSVWDSCKSALQLPRPFRLAHCIGGWKHTTAFHKSSETNRHQALKHLRQHWCYGNRSVIGNRGGWWTIRNTGDISLPPISCETSQTNKSPKHYTQTGGRNISSSLNKSGNMHNGSVPP